MFVYDYVIYNGEPIIEFRLKYLNDYVDRFIIVESIYTHSGNKKEDFFFNMNKAGSGTRPIKTPVTRNGCAHPLIVW